MSDEWKNRATSLGAPAKRFAAITPHDSTNFTIDARAIYVGVGGNIAVVSPDGDVVTFVGVQAGSILPVNARRVNSTNTTATSLVALW